ncbi:MAG: NAD(P)/FAD-dependent oxidoreductase [Phycisphaerales bacterium]
MAVSHGTTSTPHVSFPSTAARETDQPTPSRTAGPPRIIIIGAGPTGLGAGYRLKELGYTNFHIYERHAYIGGLAHSFVDDKGFTWDIGGHVMFSHYKYYDQCFDRLMGADFTLNNRESWVRMCDTWVPYPFQNNVRYLPKQIAYECLSGLIKAQTGQGKVKSPALATNFGEFIDAVFGEGIARHFMRPYNFKVWAHEPEMMNKQWIGERVAVLDIDRALKNVVLGQDDFGWGPNNQFKFPLRGGTGEFYARFGPVLHGHVSVNHAVERIDITRKEIRFTNGHVERYDILLSAMPLDVLCRDVLTESTPPGGSSGGRSGVGMRPMIAGEDFDLARIRETACRLRHSSGYMVGIGLKSRAPGAGTPDSKSWMYFPEENCPFYRVTYLSNYSPHMTPDTANYYSLLCETSESEHKPTPGKNGEDHDAMIEETIRGLERCGMLLPDERDNIVSRWCYYADYSYPTPTVDRDEILAEVIPWLESRDIYSRGRFGMWKYEVSNTDHTLMQGVELVNRLLLGEAETTIGMVYRITTDGREAAVHERSAHAGSGEKKPAPAGATPRTHDDATPSPAPAPEVVVRTKPVGDIDEADLAEEELGVTQRRE